jgi:hypothetical protein
MVNEQIEKDLPVSMEVMPLTKAQGDRRYGLLRR